MAGAAPDLRFDLVVATVDRTAELETLLQSLEGQTHRHFRLVVVDQNADDRRGRQGADPPDDPLEPAGERDVVRVHPRDVHPPSDV